VRGWPDDGTGTAVPEADVEAVVAWGRFTDAGEALLQLEQALPGLERGVDHRALLLALHGRAVLSRLAGRPLAEIVDAADVLEHAAEERRAPVWAATAMGLRARARLDAGEIGPAMNDLTRVHLDQLAPALTDRAGLLLLDALAGAYSRMRLDERVDEVRSRLEEGLAAAMPLDRAMHWASWSTQLAARALDPVAAGRGEPDQSLLERALAVSARIDELPRSVVPDRLRRGVQGVRALAAAYRGRPSEALRLLGQDAFGEPRELQPLERQIVTLAAIHAHALVGSVATARSLDEAATSTPAGLPHLVLEACRARERLWLESHAGGSVVPVLTRLDGVLARIGWLGMDLVAQTARQVLEHQALRVESRTDPLTGVGNRRALDEELRHMLRFTPMPLALVLVDIDHFKQVNDAFTHVVGDEVLRRVAECLGRELRVGDHLARYGGDEFIALLPRTGDQEARQVAQRMSDAITRLPWSELADGLTVGVSTGSAALWSLTGRRPDRDAENLFRRADEALLEAKRRRAEGGRAAVAWPAPRRRRPPSLDQLPVRDADPALVEPDEELDEAADPIPPIPPVAPVPAAPPHRPPTYLPPSYPAQGNGPVSGPITAPVTAPLPGPGHGAHGRSDPPDGGDSPPGRVQPRGLNGSGYGTGYDGGHDGGYGTRHDGGYGTRHDGGYGTRHDGGYDGGYDTGYESRYDGFGPVPPPAPAVAPTTAREDGQTGGAGATPPEGAVHIPGLRSRRRPTVIDLSGASSRTPFG
jgi:diguanylate cyclase (GGDEF)-like protein